METKVQIVATNGKYEIIQRGSRYAVLEKGKPLSSVRKWRGKSLLHIMLTKADYDRVTPPKAFSVKEKWVTEYANETDKIISNGRFYRLIENYGTEKKKAYRITEKDLKELLKVGGFTECAKEDEITKGRLDRGKLVKKKVPIKSADGKVHMGYRWVKPGEDTKEPSQSTPRSNTTTPGLKPGETYADVDNDDVKYDIQTTSDEGNFWDGLDDDFEDTSIDLDDFDIEQMIADFEAKENSNEDNTQSDDDEIVEIINVPVSTYHSRMREILARDIEGSRGKPDKTMAELFDTAVELSEIGEDEDFDEYRKYVRDYCCTDEDLFEYEDDPYQLLGKLSRCAECHWDVVRERVTKAINDNPKADTFVKAVQKGVLDKAGSSNKRFVQLGTEPRILKHALIFALGEEEYLEYRKFLNNSNITINMPKSHIEDIMVQGYKGKTLQHFLERSTPGSKRQQVLDTFERAMECEDFDSAMEFINDHRYDNRSTDWDSLTERATAEYYTMGLDLWDRRPCYIAYNPDGSKDGGAPEYGDGGVVEVSMDVLANCTISPDDSFNTNICIPKIHSEDHLKDLHILKSLIDDGGIGRKMFRDSTLGDPQNWIKGQKTGGSIPLELQYHEPVIPPSKLKVIN